MSELSKKLHDDYLKAVAEQRSSLEAVASESFTAEDEQRFQKAEDEIRSLKSRLDLVVAAEKRQAEDADLEQRVHSALPAVSDDEHRSEDASDELQKRFRDLHEMRTRGFEIKPEGRMNFRALRDMAETRTLSKLTAGAGGATVQTSFSDQFFANLIEVSGVLAAGATILNTAGGEALQVPKTTSHSTGALTAEAAVIAASDPAFAIGTLNAYKYAVLVQMSNELLTDPGVDLTGYIAMETGRAVGNAFGVHAITGTGTSQPAGIVTGATVGVTGGTGVAGVFTADNLIDLFYSVIAPYRNSRQAAWMMKDSTLATVRKIKDTTGQYLWQPSVQIDVPDTLLGKPVYTDPNVAAPAINAKSVIFGDMSRYLVRMVEGIRFERSDEFAFSSDLVTFRCILRADGLLIDQTGAVKVFQGAAS